MTNETKPTETINQTRKRVLNRFMDTFLHCQAKIRFKRVNRVFSLVLGLWLFAWLAFTFYLSVVDDNAFGFIILFIGSLWHLNNVITRNQRLTSELRALYFRRAYLGGAWEAFAGTVDVDDLTPERLKKIEESLTEHDRASEAPEETSSSL